MASRPSYIRRRLLSFGHAGRGILRFFQREEHAKIHGLATVLVIGLGFYCSITVVEWMAVVGCIGLVLAMEILNSAIERLTDLAHPHFHEKAGLVKDMAAGAVLVAATVAAVIGALVFVPYFIS